MTKKMRKTIKSRIPIEIATNHEKFLRTSVSTFSTKNKEFERCALTSKLFKHIINVLNSQSVQSLS